MKKNRSSNSKTALIAYALTTNIYITVVGRLMFSEIIALLSFPFLNFSFLYKKFKGVKIVINGLIFFLLVQVISDVTNGSISRDYLRGWSLMLFSIISTVFLVRHFSKNKEAVVQFLFATFIIQLLFGEADLDLDIISENSNLFKVRFVGFLNTGLMLTAYYLYVYKKYFLVISLFLVYGLVCLALDARSNGLIFIFSAILLFIKNNNIKINKVRLFLISIFTLFFLYLGYVFYVNSVVSGVIGGRNSRTQISQMSNPYNPFELLYFGRIDAVISVFAIMDKPFLGHGSWAKDKSGKYYFLEKQLTGSNLVSDRGFIKNHSLLLGAWLYAGVFGFISILYIVISLIRMFFKNIYNSNQKSPILPILTVMVMNMTWAMFFSPFGLLRTSFPIFAALIIVYSNHYLQLNLIAQNNKIHEK